MHKKRILYGNFVSDTTPPKIINWMISAKIVKKESQALFILAIVIFTSLFVTYTNINTIITGRFTIAQASIIQTLLLK